jgi:hypothetical protein
LTQGDPTDEALVTIAGILDQPQAVGEMEAPATGSPPIAGAGVDGYTKVGPGPMEAVRFRWSVRRAENGEYFVDEMIGENPASVVIGPMTAEAAVRLVDERESDARRRFEQIRSEMISRVVAADGAQRRGEG